ncbi:E3 ubiquitin-protein ligase hrd-1 [Morus notabilis]|uniref:E3 ubiquitin-protein ligase hrd-1 n=1 Tax=Morus notabilis TaxID=981085 RepID=W9RTR7_9ROSA|nr:E3 ubiquitin-protein ligase hrd-1 [Morus notabilis]
MATSKEMIGGGDLGRTPTCLVCFEDFMVGYEATRLPCSHIYHGNCIQKWFRKSKFCPLCRFEMPC